MAQFSAQCPHCRVKVKLQKPELIGKTAKCPACKEAFVITPLTEDTKPSATISAKEKTVVAPTTKAVASTPRKAAKPVAAAKTKARSNVDFPIEEDEILEAEEIVDDEPADEDWLKGLDAVSPTEIGKSRSRTPSAAPPVVRGRQNHAAPTSKKKRRRRVRDADGELPLWMSRALTVLIGGTVGVVTLLIWAGLIAKTGVPNHWMAMFIGATVGTGIRLGASKYDFGLFPAVTAALIALTAVIGGKVWGFHLMQRQAVERELIEARYELKMVQHENYPLHLMAEEIHQDYREQKIPDAHSFYRDDTDFMLEADIAAYYDPEQLPQKYGDRRWKEAKARWDSLTDERRADVREQIAETEQSLKEALSADVDSELAQRGRRREGGALSIFDFIFAGIAVVGAFKIAAGMADSAIDTSGPG